MFALWTLSGLNTWYLRPLLSLIKRLKMVAGFCVLAVITHYTERAPAEGPWLFLLPDSATPAMSLLMLWVFQALTILVISWETRTAKGYATQLDIWPKAPRTLIFQVEKEIIVIRTTIIIVIIIAPLIFYEISPFLHFCFIQTHESLASRIFFSLDSKIRRKKKK